MDEIEAIDAFDDQVAALEASLGGAQAMAAAFDGELTRLGQTVSDAGRGVGDLSRGMGGNLKRAFEGLIFDGKSLEDSLRGVAESIARTAYSAAVTPVTNALGGALSSGIQSFVAGVLPFADGARFSQGRVMPFARGGVVSGPVAFPMRGGVGLMGEAGPEAIMPLARGADGRLGVRAAGGGRPVQVVMNIATPDVEGFRRSQSQIAAQASRALSRGQRNL